ncbi:MAG: sensory box protein [Massilia sp.]|jgi:PAS domain S-box-containing protein|nr:sensory box protein [Massilia sp.]
MNLDELEVNYHAMLMGWPDASALFDLDSGRLLDANDKAAALFGFVRVHLPEMSLAQVCLPGRQAELLVAEAQRASRCGSVKFESELRTPGAALPCEVILVRLPVPGRRLLHACFVDISRRVRAERLREGEGRVLELIASGAPLGDILERLVLLIESQSDGVLCSVLLLDDDGVTIRPAAGPSLPPEYMAALDGMRIGPGSGSCGSAMHANDIVIVPDILVDPCWAPYKALAEPHGLRACWSMPIAPDKRTVLGSFAMYYRDVRSPTEDDMRLIEIAAHLAGIAIERTRRGRELSQHREHLESMVTARTSDLTRAVGRADLINRELSHALDTLSLAKDELVRRDKLAALGALVAGVAHELNTPIGNSLVVATALAERTRAIVANLAGGLRRSVLERYLADAGEAGELLVRNLKRAATLVAGFKQIAVDHASLERREFSLTQLLSELAAPLKVAARGAQVTLALELEPGLMMDSYPGPLSQVVTELFENSLAHAFSDERGGAVRIAAAMAGGDLVAISVEDDGAGMTPKVQARVYDPFFTTRMGTGRSGLGLHVAHNIVSNILGGRIELRSAPGHGACFTLVLPLAAPPGPAPAAGGALP